LCNVAIDLEVNQMAVADGYKLPQGKGILANDLEHEVELIFPQSFAKELGLPTPDLMKTWEYYYAWLLKNKPEASKDIDHNHWAPPQGGETQELTERFIAQAVQEAVQAVGTQGLCGKAQECISSLIKVLKPNHDWTQDI